MAVHTCNLSIQDVETKRAKIQGHFRLHSEFEASRGYIEKKSMVRETLNNE